MTTPASSESTSTTTVTSRSNGIAIEGAGIGILINDTTNQTGYRFVHLYLSGNGEGIQSPSGKRASPAMCSCKTWRERQNTLSCSVTSCEGSTLDLGGVSDVIVNRLYSHGNCGGAGWWLGPGASNVVVENSVSIDDASCPGRDDRELHR